MQTTATAETAKMRFKDICAFAAEKGVTRAWVWRNLKNQDAKTWEAYAAFIEAKAAERRRVVAEAKARIARASRIAEAENIEWHRQQVSKVYGHDFETFTK